MVEKDIFLTEEEDPYGRKREEREKELMIKKEHLHIIYNTPYISMNKMMFILVLNDKPDFGKPFYNYYLMKLLKHQMIKKCIFLK